MRIRQLAACLADVQAASLSAALDHDRHTMLTNISASLNRSVGPMIAESEAFSASLRVPSMQETAR